MEDAARDLLAADKPEAELLQDVFRRVVSLLDVCADRLQTELRERNFDKRIAGFRGKAPSSIRAGEVVGKVHGTSTVVRV